MERVIKNTTNTIGKPLNEVNVYRDDFVFFDGGFEEFNNYFIYPDTFNSVFYIKEPLPVPAGQQSHAQWWRFVNFVLSERSPALHFPYEDSNPNQPYTTFGNEWKELEVGSKCRIVKAYGRNDYTPDVAGHDTDFQPFQLWMDDWSRFTNQDVYNDSWWSTDYCNFFTQVDGVFSQDYASRVNFGSNTQGISYNEYVEIEYIGRASYKDTQGEPRVTDIGGLGFKVTIVGHNIGTVITI